MQGVVWKTTQAWLSFLIQILLIFGGRCIYYFWDVRVKIYRLPNFNILFLLALKKFFKIKPFSCLTKVDHVINLCKEPICPICKIEMDDEYRFLIICPAYQEKKMPITTLFGKEYRTKISRTSPNKIFMFLKKTIAEMLKYKN